MSTAVDHTKQVSGSAQGAPTVVVLGGGAVVRECFAPALASLGLADRTTIVDAVRGTSEATAAFTQVTGDFRQYLASLPRQSASHCVVALPNALHFDAVSAALEAGAHVLCEKPLSLSSEQCRTLAARAASAQRTLSVNMVRRLFHGVRAAAAALSQGWPGTLQRIRISHGGAYGWPIASLAPFLPANGGVLADMGVHYLDMARMLFGPLTAEAYEDDWVGGVEADCRFQLRTASGVPVDLRLSRTFPLENAIVAEGTAGTLRLGVDDFQQCVFTPVGREEPIVLSTAESARWSFGDYFTEQVRRFVAGQPGVTADDAAETAALIEWAYQHRIPRSARPADVRLENGRVFVTGGTGFIGRHLVERLTADGSGPVTAGFRSFASCASISAYPVHFERVDLLESADLRASVRGHRYLFHLAVARDNETERRLTVEGTRRLVEAAIAEGVESIVVLSTMYVFGHVDGAVTEASPYQPIGGAYGSTKADMERWLQQRAATSGRTRITTLIPTCVYGPGGDTYTKGPVECARDGRFCWIEHGSGLANIVYVENLVDAMIRAARTEAAHGERFIVNDETVTWREFLGPMLGPWLDRVPSPTPNEFAAMTSTVTPPATLRDVATSIARSPEVWQTVSRTRLANQFRPLIKKYAPAVVSLRRQAGRARVAPAVAKADPPPPWLADVYGPFRATYSSAKAERLLGWTPAIPRGEATRRSVAWLERQRLYLPPDA